MNPTFKQHALNAIEQGWAVFPLTPGDKIPMEGSHGFKDATHDRQEVEAWWNAMPDANTGGATGTISGRVVVDVDPRNGGIEGLATLEAEHGPLPPTVMVASGRQDGGFHLYFAVERELRGRKLAAGVDLKGDGGYVVLPGSIHPDSGQPYTYVEGRSPDDYELAPAPEWLWREQATAAPIPAGMPERVGEGNRNVFLTSLAGTLRRRGLGSGEIFPALMAVNETRCSPELSEKEVRSIAEGMLRYEPAADAPGLDGRPVIYITNRQLRDVADEAVFRLEEANVPPQLFVRGGSLTRVRWDERHRPMTEAMSVDHVTSRLATDVNWYRETEKGERSTQPPRYVSAEILARGEWPFPRLDRIVETPVMRSDGSVLAEDGYDAATALLYLPEAGFAMAEVPLEPKTDDVRRAVGIIEEVLCDFPFANDASRAHAVALMVTFVVAPMLDGRVPVFILDKPQPGTGASLLAEVTGIVATGRTPGMMTAPPREEEWRKLLMSNALAGHQFTVIDNLEAPLGSAALASAVTSGYVQDRILGRSEMVTVPQTTVFLGTGNNVRLAGDMARRTVWMRMDAQRSRPWQGRTFRHPELQKWVRSNRGGIVGALLTLARGWFVAGQPAPERTLGGFDEWSRVAGGIAAFAGYEGFLNNLNEVYEQADEQGTSWEAFLRALLDRYGEVSFKAIEIVDAVKGPNGSALAAVLPEGYDPSERPESLARRLGVAFRSRKDVRHGDDELRLVLGDPDRKNSIQRWRVVISGEAGSSGDSPRSSEDNNGDTSTEVVS